MDQHVADIALEELKEKRTRLARKLVQLHGAEYDEKQLKSDLYNAFIQHHRNRFPQIGLVRIHEHFLKERQALGRQVFNKKFPFFIKILRPLLTSSKMNYILL